MVWRSSLLLCIMPDQPPLKPLHAATSLSRPKLAFFERWSTAQLKQSLLPQQEHSLKARPDGVMLDGHHRVEVLRQCGEMVDALPREVFVREEDN